MMKLRKTLVLLILLSIYSCEKENIELEGRLENDLIIARLMLDALVEENTGSYQIELRSAYVENEFKNYYSVGTVSQGTAGPVLYLGMARFPSFPSRRETFPLALKFRIDELDTETSPSEDKLTGYFSVGREFSFGDADGEVQFEVLLIGGDLEDRRSRSEYTEIPEGTITVERIEPFIAQLSDISGGDREYLMITFSFAGVVGIHSAAEELEAIRNGDAYIASKTAEVSGTTTLVLAADPG